jgi:hypothetical protein
MISFGLNHDNKTTTDKSHKKGSTLKKNYFYFQINSNGCDIGGRSFGRHFGQHRFRLPGTFFFLYHNVIKLLIV